MKHIAIRPHRIDVVPSKKARPTAWESSIHEYELSNHLNSCFNSNAPVCIFQTGAFLLFSRGIVLRCRSPPFLSRFCKPQI